MFIIKVVANSMFCAKSHVLIGIFFLRRGGENVRIVQINIDMEINIWTISPNAHTTETGHAFSLLKKARFCKTQIMHQKEHFGTFTKFDISQKAEALY